MGSSRGKKDERRSLSGNKEKNKAKFLGTESIGAGSCHTRANKDLICFEHKPAGGVVKCLWNNSHLLLRVPFLILLLMFCAQTATYQAECQPLACACQTVIKQTVFLCQASSISTLGPGKRTVKETRLYIFEGPRYAMLKSGNDWELVESCRSAPRHRANSLAKPQCMKKIKRTSSHTTAKVFFFFLENTHFSPTTSRKECHCKFSLKLVWIQSTFQHWNYLKQHFFQFQHIPLPLVSVFLWIPSVSLLLHKENSPVSERKASFSHFSLVARCAMIACMKSICLLIGEGVHSVLFSFVCLAGCPGTKWKNWNKTGNRRFFVIVCFLERTKKFTVCGCLIINLSLTQEKAA